MVHHFLDQLRTVVWLILRFLVSLPEDMVKILERERKDRLLETIPETIRVILSEYLRKRK